MKPSRVLSVAPIFDSEPQCVHVEVLCSVCGESDALALNLEHPGDLSWLRRFDFYFVCGRHSPCRIQLDQPMLQPNFNPEPAAVRIHRCKYVSRSKACGCPKCAALIAEKVTALSRYSISRAAYAPSTTKIESWIVPSHRFARVRLGAIYLGPRSIALGSPSDSRRDLAHYRLYAEPSSTSCQKTMYPLRIVEGSHDFAQSVDPMGLSVERTGNSFALPTARCSKF
jgi:hypothetical protein